MKELIDTLKEKIADPIKEKLHDPVSVPPLKDLGQKKTKVMIDELNDNLPVFERAGFALQRMEVEIGVSPGVTPMFSITNLLPKEEQKALLNEIRSNRLQHSILQMLFNTAAFVGYVNVGELQFYMLKVTLGTLPKVALVFDRPSAACQLPANLD